MLKKANPTSDNNQIRCWRYQLTPSTITAYTIKQEGFMLAIHHVESQIKIWQLSGLTDPFGWKNITIALWNETRVASVFPTRGSIWISIFQILCSLYLRLKIDPLRLDLDPSRRRQLPGGGPIWISISQILCSLLSYAVDQILLCEKIPLCPLKWNQSCISFSEPLPRFELASFKYFVVYLNKQMLLVTLCILFLHGRSTISVSRSWET